MIAPAAGPRTVTSRSALLVFAASAVAAATLACGGPTTYEIPIETPIQPKLDVAPFQRVLVAGFVTGGSDDVDANLETVRLLRSQLRTKSQLKVIDADVMPLNEIAQDQSKPAGAPAESTAAEPQAAAPVASASDPSALNRRA